MENTVFERPFYWKIEKEDYNKIVFQLENIKERRKIPLVFAASLSLLGYDWLPKAKGGSEFSCH